MALSLFFHVYILCFHNNKTSQTFHSSKYDKHKFGSILENKTNKGSSYTSFCHDKIGFGLHHSHVYG